MSLAELSAVADSNGVIWSSHVNCSKPWLGYGVNLILGEKNAAEVDFSFCKEVWQKPPQGWTVLLRVERDACEAHMMRLKPTGENETFFFMRARVNLSSSPTWMSLAGTGLVRTRTYRAGMRRNKNRVSVGRVKRESVTEEV